MTSPQRVLWKVFSILVTHPVFIGMDWAPTGVQWVAYSSDHSTCYLSFLILYIASDGIVQLLLESPLNSQAIL
jgi:hypothetical protein